MKSDQQYSTQLMSKKLALFLALFGYVPFLFYVIDRAMAPEITSNAAGSIGMAMGQAMRKGVSDALQQAILNYGAIILSFLGGIRWGVAMVGIGDQKLRRLELVLSVMPSLVGWFALAFEPVHSFLILAAAFAAHGAWDVALVRVGRAPDWFGTLRIALTSLVCATLLIAAYLT